MVGQDDDNGGSVRGLENSNRCLFQGCVEAVVRLGERDAEDRLRRCEFLFLAQG